MRLHYPHLLHAALLLKLALPVLLCLSAGVQTPAGAQACTPISTLTCTQVRANLPVNLDFSGSRSGTLPDKSGAGAGFTMADAYSGARAASDGHPANTAVPGFEPSRLLVSGGRLQVTTFAGIAYVNNNNQINSLGVSVSSVGKLQVETALVNPVNGAWGVQGGLWFGLNDRTFFKLVVSANRIELRREINNLSSTVAGTANPDQRLTATISGLHLKTVRLRLVVDPVKQTAEGFYSTDGITYLNTGAAYPVKALSTAGMGLTTSRAYAGIMTTHRNAVSPVTYHFDQFSVKSLNIKPAFAAKTYNYSVSDAAALGAVAGTVKATDTNGDPLSYRLIGGNTNKAFGINAQTGAITLAKSLDYHTQDAYALRVRVADPSGASDTATVAIAITQGNRAGAFPSIAWSTGAPIPVSAHEVHGVVVKGKLYVFGGYDVKKRPSYWAPTKRAYVFDPAANQWASIADLPHTPNGVGFGGVTHFGLTTDGTDIYFAGGYPSNATGTGQVFGTNQVWRYHVSTNTYTALPALPAELAAGQLQYLKGRLHYMGGANKSRADITLHYALDLDNLAAGWKLLAPLPLGRNHAGSAVYAGKIYFLGGAVKQDASAMVQKQVDGYDPVTNTWSRVADMITGRGHISSSVVVMGDRILVLGGEVAHNAKSNKVSAYAPATNTWSEFTVMPGYRSAGVAAVLGSSLHYVSGNFTGTNYKGVTATTALASAPFVIAEQESIHEGNKLHVQVYPNPNTGGAVNVRAGMLQPGEEVVLRLFDLSGRLQATWRRRADGEGGLSTELLPLQPLPPGTYLLQMAVGSGTAQSKLVVR